MFYLKLTLIFLWSLIICAVAVPMSLLCWGNRDTDYYFSKMLAWGILEIAGVSVELQGKENLAHQPCIYVANHQSGFDVPTFGMIYPRRTIVIGKKSLVWIPIFGLVFIAAGNVALDRKNRQRAITHLSRTVLRVRNRGLSLWIFPEGTRNRSNDLLLPFKKGAFHMAIDAQVPIVPVVSQRLEPIFSWKKRRMNPGRVSLRALEPIETTGLTANDVDHLLEEVRFKMLEAIRGLAT